MTFFEVKMVKSILWDIDGTLINFKKAERAALTSAFNKIGFYDVTDDFLKRYSVLNRRYWEMLEKKQITLKELLTARFTEFFASENIYLPDAGEFNNLYQTALGEEIFPNDNSIALIKELKNSVKQYAVTNGTAKAQHAKLKNSGLDKLLDGVYISEEIGIDKPQKGFFDAVFQNPQIDINTTVLIGDSLSSDIAGAKNAKITSVWYNPENKPLGKIKPDYEIKNLWEIRKLFNI